MAEPEIEPRTPMADASSLPPTEEGDGQALRNARQRPDWSAVRAVFFDLDDTLCAYWEASKAALRASFEQCCPEHLNAESMFEHWAAVFKEFCPGLKQNGWYEAYLESGLPTRREQMRLALARAGIDDASLTDLLSQTYGEERDRALRLFEDAVDVLQVLQGRFPLGLITNGPADVQRQEIGTLGLDSYFTTVLIEGELGFGKPHERVFRLAEQAVGLGPESMLFVGNSYRHDIAPALRAGWHAIWIRRETDVPIGSDECEALPSDGPKPDAIVGCLAEVAELLGLELRR